MPSNTVKRVVPQLKRDGTVDRAFLGVSTVKVTPQLAAQLGLGVERGAMVMTVVDGSPADNAGLRGASPGATGAIVEAGDVILRVGGMEIAGPQELAEAISSRDPGTAVTIEYVRRGERANVRVQLGQRAPLAPSAFRLPP